MSFRNPLRIRNGGTTALTVIVEPWANEYELAPDADCEVVAIHPDQQPTLTVEHLERAIIVSVDGGSLYEFWRNGAQVD
jgi:hypothetical protein